MADLFAPRITDPSIDNRARYFRECTAMLDHYMTRGLSAAPDTLAELKIKAGILSTGIDRRDEIPMESLIELHATLARALAPVLPSTVELLSWDQRNSRWNWMAPVPALRWLIVFTIGFLVIFLLLSMREGVAENYGLPFLSPDNTSRVWVALFFGSLAGLGACFSVLYDARKFIVEGTYDPRVGSNYIIRIILGIVSGLILTQLLFDSTENTTGIAKPVVALLGGFASQFVYEGLNRLVDSLSGMFDTSQKKQLALREQELRAEAQEKAMLERVARSTRTMNVVAGLQTSSTDAERTDALKKLVEISVGDRIDQAAPMTSRVFKPAHDALSKARDVLSVGGLLLDVLPGQDAQRLRGRLDRITGRVDTLNSAVQAGAQGDLVGMAGELIEDLTREDPARQELGRLVRALSGPARLAGLAGGPVGLSLAVLGGTFAVGSAAYESWKARVLDAPYSPDLLPPGFPDDAAAKHALDALPDIAELLGPGIADDPAALTDFATMVAQERDDALFAEHAARFDNDRAVFDAAIERFRLQLIGDVAAPSVPRAALQDAGVEDAGALFRALDAVRSDPDAAPELDKLFLLASRARESGDATAISQLSRILSELGEEPKP